METPVPDSAARRMRVSDERMPSRQPVTRTGGGRGRGRLCSYAKRVLLRSPDSSCEQLRVTPCHAAPRQRIASETLSESVGERLTDDGHVSGTRRSRVTGNARGVTSALPELVRLALVQGVHRCITRTGPNPSGRDQDAFRHVTFNGTTNVTCHVESDSTAPRACYEHAASTVRACCEHLQRLKRYRCRYRPREAL